MAAPIFQIGATFDKTQLTAGFDSAVTDAKGWATRMDVTFEGASSSTKRWMAQISEDTKQAAAGASVAQLRGAEATKVNIEAQKELAAATKLAKGPLGETSEVTALLAAAQQRAAAAAKAHAVAMGELAGASHAAVSGVQATSGAIRTLEGNAGLRAIENFVSKTLGLGPAMQAIFPIIGGLAFGKVLIDMGEKLYEVAHNAEHAGEVTREAFDAAHSKALVRLDDLNLENDKLQQQIDKLSGHSNDGLQFTLDEARKMADQLADSLRTDKKELDALLKDHEVSTFASLLTGVASTGKQHKELMADQEGLANEVRKANAEYQAALAGDSSENGVKAAGERRATAIRTAYQAQIDAYKKEAGRLREEQTRSQEAAAAAANAGGDFGGGSVPVVDNGKKIANVEGRASQLQDAMQLEMASEKHDHLEHTLAPLKQDKANAPKAGAENKEAEQRFKQMEADLNEEKLEYNLSVKAVFDFWAARRNAFVQGSEQYNQVTAKMAEQAVAGTRAASEALKKVKTEQSKQPTDQMGQAAVAEGMAAMQKMSEQIDDNFFQRGAKWDGYWKEVAKGQEITATLSAEMDSARDRALEAAGGMTKLGLAQKEAEIHTRQHAAVIAALIAELERLEAQADKDPISGKYKDPKQAGQIAQVKNQIQQEQGKGQVQGIQDKTAINDEIAKPYTDAFKAINSGWLSVQQSLIMGNKNVGRAFAEMGAGLVTRAAAEAEQWLAQRAMAYLRDVVLHHAAEGQKTAATVAGATATTAAAAASATTSQVTTATANVAQVLSYAAVAAAAAAASAAAIPIVGPAAAPAAAAATYAEVAGTYAPLAAFDVGTAYVPHDGVAMIHKGETILPPPQAQVLRDALSGGAGGGDMHLHMGGNSFASADGNFHGQFEANQSKMIGSLKRWHREGKLNFGGS